MRCQPFDYLNLVILEVIGYFEKQRLVQNVLLGHASLAAR
jgi:hypothetical protein